MQHLPMLVLVKKGCPNKAGRLEHFGAAMSLEFESGWLRNSLPLVQRTPLQTQP